jgi:hypothetical protein
MGRSELVDYVRASSTFHPAWHDNGTRLITEIKFRRNANVELHRSRCNAFRACERA